MCVCALAHARAHVHAELLTFKYTSHLIFCLFVFLFFIFYFLYCSGSDLVHWEDLEGSGGEGGGSGDQDREHM